MLNRGTNAALKVTLVNLVLDFLAGLIKPSNGLSVLSLNKSNISIIRCSESVSYSAILLISNNSSLETGLCLVLISINNLDSSCLLKLLHMTTGTRSLLLAKEKPYILC